MRLAFSKWTQPTAYVPTQLGCLFHFEVKVHTVLYLSLWDFRKDTLFKNVKGPSTTKTNQHKSGVCQKYEIFVYGLYELYSYNSITNERNYPIN